MTDNKLELKFVPPKSETEQASFTVDTKQCKNEAAIIGKQSADMMLLAKILDGQKMESALLNDQLAMKSFQLAQLNNYLVKQTHVIKLVIVAVLLILACFAYAKS